MHNNADAATAAYKQMTPVDDELGTRLGIIFSFELFRRVRPRCSFILARNFIPCANAPRLTATSSAHFSSAAAVAGHFAAVDGCGEGMDGWKWCLCTEVLSLLSGVSAEF